MTAKISYRTFDQVKHINGVSLYLKNCMNQGHTHWFSVSENFRIKFVSGTSLEDCVVLYQAQSKHEDRNISNLESLNMTYATLITSDSFLPGLQVLWFSLQATGTKLPLVILYISNNLSQSTIRRLSKLHNTILKPVSPIAISSTVSHVQGWIDAGYTKLHVFNMTNYDKVVYLDADTMVLEKIDELFEEKGFAAAPDLFPPDKFNAGVLVLQPDVDMFNDMLSRVHNLASYDGGDTGFLNAYFSDWYAALRRLPFSYNAQRTMHWITSSKNMGYWESIHPIKILHYSSNPKPWENCSRKGDLEMMWHQKFLEFCSST